MNDSPSDGSASAYHRAPHKEYDIASSKPKAFMVEDAQWERIHDRVEALEAKGSVDWLMALATMVGGIAASAGLALIALPRATAKENLDPSVKPVLWAVLIAGSVVAVTMGLLWLHLRKERSRTATDICNEMETIQQAWQERENP